MFWSRDIHSAIKSGKINTVKSLLRDPRILAQRDRETLTPLMVAVRYGTKEIVQLLLQAGSAFNVQGDNADPNFSLELKDRLERTALIHAVRHGNADMVQLLLQAGANVNMQDVSEQSVLMHAVKHASPEIIQLLLLHKPDLELRAEDGSTALSMAICAACPDIVTLLINAGVALRAEDGSTALSMAIRAARLDIVTLLINAGVAVATEDTQCLLDAIASPSYRCKYAMLKLMVNRLVTVSPSQKEGLSKWFPKAVEKNDLEMVRKLLRLGVSMQQLDTHQVLRHEVVAKLLVEYGYNLNKVINKYGDTQLIDAAYYGRVETVNKLLNLGAEINLADNFGRTALYWAIKEERLAVAKLMLTHPTAKSSWLFDIKAFKSVLSSKVYDLIPHFFSNPGAIDFQDAARVTPIHHVIAANDLTALEILLKQQPNLEQSEHVHGDTPLLYAARLGHGSLLPMLLRAKPKLKVCDKQGRTALHLLVSAIAQAGTADKSGVAQVQPLLDQGIDCWAKDAEGKTALCWALEHQQTAIAEQILAYQAARPISERVFDAKAFVVAVTKALPVVVQKILSITANMEVQNSDGRTPLHMVIQENNPAAVRRLLEQKPNLEHRETQCGLTPLQAAASMGNAEIVSQLLRKDANVEAQTSDGTTTLHLAIQAGATDCLKWLLLRSVNLELANKAGDTPLLYAARLGREHMVSALLEAGANMDATNCQGQTVMDCALQSNVMECALLLKRHFDKKRQQAQLKPTPAPLLPSQTAQLLRQLLAENRAIKAQLDKIEQRQLAQKPGGPS